MRPQALVTVIIALGLAGASEVRAAPPYALPWHLRGATPTRVIRLDSVVARYEDAAGRSGSTRVALLLASAKVGAQTSVLGRIGVVNNEPPTGAGASVLTNLIVGTEFAPRSSGAWRVGFYGLVGLPIGGGGGNDPRPAASTAIKSGPLARSAMDNTMFAVNDLVVLPGVDVALVAQGWTVQGEATLFGLWRVRGERKQPDARRTNFTCGLHVGRFVTVGLSLGGELRYQRWLSTPAAVAANPKSRDTATLALGPRFHIKTGEKSWLRPGVAVALPLDAPMKDADYLTVQIDLPYVF